MTQPLYPDIDDANDYSDERKRYLTVDFANRVLEDDQAMKFKKTESSPSFPTLEAESLSYWQSDNTFQRTLERTKNSEEYIFYDGPPFPTGTPHHGTIFVSILKDVIPRYKTMRGYYVPRVWGWDCHGLPIETQAEKTLGIDDKSGIEKKVGVKAFNNECRRIVSDFNEAWRVYIDRIGRWVDMDNAYQTLDRSFMESVIWSFAESYKKELVYKDFRVNPYCYRCQTPLSISDTRSDDATRPRQDPTVTARLKINELDNTYFLIWTTTPWTLPSNLAVAAGADIDYVVVETTEGERYILAEALLPSYQKELGEQAVVKETLTGQELADRHYSYQPLYPYFADDNPNGFKILLADFVTTEEGTGLVHIAPGFGEDDYWLGRQYNVAAKVPVDDHGCFTEIVADFVGDNVHDANPNIIRDLKERRLIVRHETLDHNYPHCWRCRTPLIYKAVDAWYFSIEKVKQDLIKNNKDINWYPESVRDGRFGKWLANARDWNISRNRYWATPIPVWKCDQCDEQEVLANGEEIEAKAGQPVPDLHKEFLDEITYDCKQCDGTMIRTPEVLDGWWESGSMPYGQYHYPFENAEHFRDHFPADFIVEYTGQIRCWFYYLHVMATALFDKPAFKNCLTHGTLLAADGKKISKSLKNYTDPMGLMDHYGADAVRAYLLSSSAVQMADLSFKDEGVEEITRKMSLPLWHALSFLTTYTEADDIALEDINKSLDNYQTEELDQYILSITENLIEDVTDRMDRYAIHEACRMLPDFLETLNNWYIRRSRRRAWLTDKKDPSKLAFYAVLYRVLTRFTLVYAPFCPFLAEAVWKRLMQDDSVHMEQWPTLQAQYQDRQLSDAIAVVRRVVTAGLAIRTREKIRVRQPLSKVTVATQSNINLSVHVQTIQEELNVKTVEFLDDPEKIATSVGKPKAKLLGPKFGAAVQDIIKQAKAGNFSMDNNGSVQVGEYTLSADEIDIEYVGKAGAPVAADRDVVVSLDVNLTPELEREGYARDLVRHIQELRKTADLNVSDRIVLSVHGADDVLGAHRDYIMNETLAVSIEKSVDKAKGEVEVTLGDTPVEIALSVAA
ncbi:MAG: isoleucine--tRNA ligase [Gammaproteobacteria bacterium]|nr:isoleucine--tRNA ligase [Gammaproteobacteria bacterium]